MSFDLKDYLEKKKDSKMVEKQTITSDTFGGTPLVMAEAPSTDRKVIEDFVIATAPEKMTMREFRELVALVEDAYYRAKQ